CLRFFVVLRMPRPMSSPLFPYTTLFRSHARWSQLASQILVSYVLILLQCLVSRYFLGFVGVRCVPNPPTSHTDFQFYSLIAITDDRKSTRLNSSHVSISYAVFCLTKTT